MGPIAWPLRSLCLNSSAILLSRGREAAVKAVTHFAPMRRKKDNLRPFVERTSREWIEYEARWSFPPREVNIMDESGQRIEETIGPVDEGSNVTLICEAEGGKVYVDFIIIG
ncbi:hypothetical protein CDAR_212641 [Caerostris darwini]|uniref:Ig-like domain-containing protein n=1 Tax=Caerostris darwini TaxID=1538125 RepID=A0AAV4PUR1_9ARAC|nr:hypothetical protein CDAR_212641 [Caerostris darwini]